ncbi:metallophosphoesterase [Actinoplanes sp. NPDC023801]|uniref:metallophosphoesterase n=1 Tax=Actinoplanes sp. NPDC023801 TaxID=3154595 RepID=UPI0033E5B827
MGAVVIVGDVGGCARQLAEALEPWVGVPDAVVIQVGDLVDRGPDSAGVLRLVEERLGGSAPRWVQLVGNHESPYLGAEPFWPVPLADGDAGVLRRWWLTERMRVAAAVRAADGEEFLLTHAGLSVAAWRELGGPVTASTAAELLNTRPEALLCSDGGPLWAEAPAVYGSWLDERLPLPFSQVHGHSAIVDYGRRVWLCPERVRQRSVVDWEARRTVTRLTGGGFVAVDPKHGRSGADRWAPLVLPGARLLV